MNSWIIHFYRMMTFSVNCVSATHLKKHIRISKNPINSGYNSQTAFKKIKLSESLLTDQDNYAYLKKVWSSEILQLIKTFLLVKQQKCSTHPGSDEKSGSVLPR